MAVVAGALRHAVAGRGTTLFVVAEPGLGKTTVLTAARALADTEPLGAALRAVSISEVESVLPFGMLARLLGPLDAPEDPIAPCRRHTLGSRHEPGSRDEPDSRDEPGSRHTLGSRHKPGSRDAISSSEALARQYTALVEWLEHAARGPLVLLVDDMHWADRDSLGLLGLLCRRVADLPVVLLATLRPWPAAALDQARELAGRGVATVLELQPLSDGAARTLLLQHAGGPIPDATAQQALRMCAGNPLLLAETAGAWARGQDVLDGDASTLAARVLLPRFAGVGAAGLALARAASVLGTRFRSPVAADISGLDDPEVLDGLDALCRAGLVRGRHDGEDEFVHPLFRKALYEDMPIPVRRELHARAFRALRASAVAPAESAAHGVRAGLTGDPLLAATLLDAGRAALAAGAAATAAEHFAHAVAVAGNDAPVAAHIELGEANLMAGRIDAAAQGLGTLLARPALTDPERVGVLRLLAQVQLLGIDHEQADRTARTASDVAARFDPVLACDIVLDTTFMGWLFVGPRRARAVTRRVLDTIATSSLGDERLRVSAMTADAMLGYMLGDPSGLDTMADLARAADAAGQFGPDRAPWTWDVRFAYVNLAKLAERFDDDEAGYSRLATAACEHGSTLAQHAYAITRADSLWRLGRLQESYDLLARTKDLMDLVPMLAPFACVGLAHVTHEMGLQEESAMWRERLHRLMAGVGESPYLRLWLLLIACHEHLAHGSPADAAADATQAMAVAADSGLLEPCIVPWHGAAIEAMSVAGDLDHAEELACDLLARCQPLPCHAPRAVALAGKATIAWRRGQVDEAESLYEAALAHNAQVPMPLAEAETLLLQGRFLRRCGRTGPAGTALQRALDLVKPAGAARLQAIAVRELAAAGVRRRRRAPSEPTEQERRVAVLAAQGLTNKEIAQHLYVSAKTVDHHLSRVYAKLGISSRRQLILARDRLGSTSLAAAPSAPPGSAAADHTTTSDG